jgi:hypothetical protein
VLLVPRSLGFIEDNDVIWWDGIWSYLRVCLGEEVHIFYQRSGVRSCFDSTVFFYALAIVREQGLQNIDKGPVPRHEA